MPDLLESLAQGRVLLSDGAWGTFLHEKGLKPGECPEAWNLTHAGAVLDIARSYIDAGSDMIETNSFGGNRFKLQHYGYDGQVHEINRAAAEISRGAAGPNRHVLGSMGPTGKILMMGDVSEEELYEAFREQAAALEEGGADAIIVETMSDLEEARIAVSAAKEHTGCRIVCTMTFEKTAEGEFRTMMGVAPAEVPAVLISAGADVVGSNCGNGTEDMVSVLAELRKADASVPLIIQGNAGLPRYLEGETVFSETPEKTSSFVPRLIAQGANIIGGCCGTTPQHIRMIGARVRKN